MNKLIIYKNCIAINKFKIYKGYPMKNDTLKCPKCQSIMVRGRLYTVAAERTSVDKMFGYVNWEATEEKKFDGIFAYKCPECGYIEYYAKKKH
jgi:uncharacterized C2H2 Zn-finger protein